MCYTGVCYTDILSHCMLRAIKNMPLCFGLRLWRFLRDCYAFCDGENENEYSTVTYLPYILAYKSLPRQSRPPKNRVHMLSKIIDPCISRRYSKLTTCCIVVRILGGFYDAQLKCSIVRQSLSLRRSSHFRQMWLQLTRPTRPAIGADITWHTGLLLAAIITFQDSRSKRSRRRASIYPAISRPPNFWGMILSLILRLIREYIRYLLVGVITRYIRILRFCTRRIGQHAQN